MKAKDLTKNSIVRAALVTAAILMIPLLLRWPWGREDFIIMGTMIFLTDLMLTLILKKAGKFRIYAAIVIVGLFLWLYAELAVGLFTNWGS